MKNFNYKEYILSANLTVDKFLKTTLGNHWYLVYVTLGKIL